MTSVEVVVTRARAGSLALARAVPVWAWLTSIVVVSAGVRFALARHVVAPWIMLDAKLRARSA